MTAQEDDDPKDDVLQGKRFEAALFRNDFRGGARFFISSQTLDYTPPVPQRLGGPLTGYNTHMATYLNSAERFPVFVQQGASLAADFDQSVGYYVDSRETTDDEITQPALYEFATRSSVYEGTDQIVQTYATPLEHDAENLILDAQNFNDQADIEEFRF